MVNALLGKAILISSICDHFLRSNNEQVTIPQGVWKLECAFGAFQKLNQLYSKIP